MAQIYVFEAVEILMPDTMCEGRNDRNKLYRTIREKFVDARITPISRIHFCDTAGLERVRDLCAIEYSSVELIVKHKYYALAAGAALLKYVEFAHHVVYAPKSMRVEFRGSPNTTVIDMESARGLELVASQCEQRNVSLLGTLDRCATPMGRRLLRASILQPPCDQRIIMQRQSCVAELVTDASLRLRIQPIVRRLFGADRLLTLSMESTQTNNCRCAEQNLNYVLLLKNSLDVVPELSLALRDGNAPFFRNVLNNLESPQFELMREKILTVIHPEARSVMGYTSSNMQRCFAIKAGINDLLDIARQTYCELIDDMSTLVEDLACKYKLNLSLECNATLGYHIRAAMPQNASERVSELHSEFVKIQRGRNALSMTTDALTVLGRQCRMACEELHLMSNALLCDLLKNMREHVGCLFQLSADVAELDLLVSLAQIGATPGYARPTFGPNLILSCSSHPIMEAFGIDRPTANDVKATAAHNFHVISGSNMSGKSTYLKQIVLLQIMAQIGSYVPAKQAEFRIADRIFCKICFRDDIESNASTFVLEMKEAQYILQSVTSRSLVILDEVCRGTTVEEGASIAWAICEKLLLTPAFTFVTTHFSYLTKLADVYPGVVNASFETVVQPRDGHPGEGERNQPRLVYTHRLKIDSEPTDDYGIALAKLCGLPTSVVERGREYALDATKLAELRCTTAPRTRESLCYDLVAELYGLMETNEFTREKIDALASKLRESDADTATIRPPQEVDSGGRRLPTETSTPLASSVSSASPSKVAVNAEPRDENALRQRSGLEEHGVSPKAAKSLTPRSFGEMQVAFLGTDSNSRSVFDFHVRGGPNGAISLSPCSPPSWEAIEPSLASNSRATTRRFSQNRGPDAEGPRGCIADETSIPAAISPGSVTYSADMYEYCLRDENLQPPLLRESVLTEASIAEKLDEGKFEGNAFAQVGLWVDRPSGPKPE